MKKLYTCMLAAVVASLALAEKLTIKKGDTKPLDPGFKVEKFDDGKSGVVSVGVSDGVALVTGLAEGSCTVKLSGGGQTELYEIVVGNDITEVRRDLVARLESKGVTGVEVVLRNGYLTVTGEVNDPGEWSNLKSVVAEKRFADYVENDAKFEISADLMKRFRDEILAAGIKLVDNMQDAEKGALFIRKDYKDLTISGKLFSPDSLGRLNRIVAAQSWLRLADAPSTGDEGDDWKKICHVNVALDQRLLHMDVVLIGYEENEGFKYGKTDGTPILSTVFDGLVDLVHGKAKNDTFKVNANINSTIDFLAENNITRKSIGGYLRFKSNDSEPNELRIGGTLKVKMKSNSGLGGSDERFEDIRYGFTVNKTEANLIDDKNVHVKLDISQENPVPIVPGGYEEGYKVEEYKYNPVLDLPLGQTMVIGGYRRMVETTTPPSGFPVLRHVPIVNWFVSKESNSIENMKLMMLVSVRAVEPNEPEPQKATLPYEESKNLPMEVEITNEERLKEREPFSGFWSWLNWFVW
ncbi:MAG: hypothetical protein IJI54_00180 [Kiritimatiellae bacterium]|nr:hypothetical protein [Kiritimatiellia bacterium]